MFGNVLHYTPQITFTVKLESGSNWGDLTLACQKAKEELELYSGFKRVSTYTNMSNAVLPCVNFTCYLKPNASLALAEMTVYTTLRKHSIQ